MLKSFCLLITVSFVTIFSAPNLQGQNKKTNEFIAAYLDVAFRNNQLATRPLVKWVARDTLKYRIFGRLSFMSKKEWHSFVGEVSELTGIAIIETAASDYDIIVYFGNLKDYAKLSGANIPITGLQNYSSWNNRLRTSEHHLKFASGCSDPAKIKDGNYGAYITKRNFLRSMGLLGAIKNDYSIFTDNNSKVNRSLFKIDKRLIKLHYQEAVMPGMEREELRKAVKSLPDIEKMAVEKL